MACFRPVILTDYLATLRISKFSSAGWVVAKLLPSMVPSVRLVFGVQFLCVFSAFVGTRARPGGSAANPSCHSFGNGKCLLVGTGAVRPLTGVAFGKSLVKDMGQHGFIVIWFTCFKFGYMRCFAREPSSALGRLSSFERCMTDVC